MNLIHYKDTVEGGDKITVINATSMPETNRALVTMHTYFQDDRIQVQSFAVSKETAAALARALMCLLKSGHAQTLAVEPSEEGLTAEEGATMEGAMGEE